MNACWIEGPPKEPGFYAAEVMGSGGPRLGVLAKPNCRWLFWTIEGATFYESDITRHCPLTVSDPPPLPKPIPPNPPALEPYQITDGERIDWAHYKSFGLFVQETSKGFHTFPELNGWRRVEQGEPTK